MKINQGHGDAQIERDIGLEKINALTKKIITIPFNYQAQAIGEHRPDLLVEEKVVVELKSVERIEPVFEAQVLSYLKISGKKVGLLIRGIQRFIL